MELTKHFAADVYEQALEEWGWIGLDGKTPLMTSLFGDVFLRDDEGCWYLDVVRGTLDRLWPDEAAMHDALEADDVRDRLLLAPLVDAAQGRGLRLKGDEVFDFTISPVVGGSLESDNMTPMSFVVAVDMAGQLHGQLRDVPDGTPIKGFRPGAHRTRPRREAKVSVGQANVPKRKWFRG